MDAKLFISKVPVDLVIEADIRLKRAGHKYKRGVEHNSLVVDLEKNKWYWNSIGISGDAFTWLTKIRGLSYRESFKVLQDYSGLPFTNILDQFERPVPIYPKLLNSFFELGKYYREYWYARGLTDATIDHFKLGYTGKAFVIPMIVEGELVNFMCRIGNGANKRVWRWSKGRPPYPFNTKIKKTKYVFLAEGPPDAIVLSQLGLPAMSQDSGPYSWRPRWNKYLVRFNNIFVLYDNDQAGIVGARRTANKLLNKGYILFWPSFFADKYDINKCLLEYGEDKTKQLITEVMLPLAVHSTEANKAAKCNRLQEMANYKKQEVAKLAREVLYDRSSL